MQIRMTKSLIKWHEDQIHDLNHLNRMSNKTIEVSTPYIFLRLNLEDSYSSSMTKTEL